MKDCFIQVLQHRVETSLYSFVDMADPGVMFDVLNGQALFNRHAQHAANQVSIFYVYLSLMFQHKRTFIRSVRKLDAQGNDIFGIWEGIFAVNNGVK